jgi:Tfp pilus assembly protein PilV
MFKRECAFTVAEVLVALGFLATVLVTVASLFISTARASDEAGEIAPALLAARQIIEQTRNELRTNPDSSESQSFWNNEYPSSPWAAEQIQIGSEEFFCSLFTTNVRNADGDPLGGRSSNLLKRVRVEVSWQRDDKPGYGNLSEEVVTLFAR